MVSQMISSQLPVFLRAAFFLILVCACSPDTTADEVVIINGNTLSGKVVRQDAGVLRLKTTFAGTISIEWDQVAKLVLSEPVTIILDDAQVLNIAAIFHEGGRFVLHPVSSSTPITVNATRVRVIAPDPWELGTGHKLTGNINIAMKNEKGNSEKNEFDLDFKFNNRWQKNNLLVIGDLEYDTTRSIRSTDNWAVMGNLDHLFSGKWFYSGSISFKNDHFADLKLRTLLGPGLGYRFFDSKAIHLRLEAGPYYLQDVFYDQPEEKFWGPAWFLDYDQFVYKQRLQVYHRQTGFLAADEPGKYLWRSWTGIRIPLISGLVGSAEYEIDYDSEPATEAEKTDQTFRLKLGYKW